MNLFPNNSLALIINKMPQKSTKIGHKKRVPFYLECFISLFDNVVSVRQLHLLLKLVSYIGAFNWPAEINIEYNIDV